MQAHALAYTFLKRHPGVNMMDTKTGQVDVPELVHMEETRAQEIGIPGAYDYGPERTSWLTHHITNWIGDDGFLAKHKSQIRRHNPDGDVIFIDGVVSRKWQEGGKNLVEISQRAETHRGELSATGAAIVELPGRTA